MKRELLSKALGDIDQRFILEAYHNVSENSINSTQRIDFMSKKRFLSFILAAALVLSLAITAYAVFFSIKHRTPDADEHFLIHWKENPDGYIEWSNAKLAITFPETEVSHEIVFRPSWLPEKMKLLSVGDEWLSRFTAESLSIPNTPYFVPEYENMCPPLLIETYSISQFNNGGALLLLYYTPDNPVEEHWDEQNVDVLRFHCTQHFDAVPENDISEFTLEQNIIVMTNTEKGWIIRVCGMIDMDTLLIVAKNLEIKETGKLLMYDDFSDHYAFFDGGVG